MNIENFRKLILSYNPKDLKEFENLIINELISICEKGDENNLSSSDNKFIDLVCLHLIYDISKTHNINISEVEDTLNNNFYDYKYFKEICYDILNTNDDAIPEYSYNELIAKIEKYKSNII